MAEKQTIEGGSLLSSIVALFFKGLDNILDSAAEYEEEMGVLKQVNHIPLQDKDGKQYELTIKLAPVRDKKGIYYVEASTDKPGFDVSSMNGIAVQLNNQTMKEFNAKVNELIEKNKLTVVKDDKKDESEGEPADSMSLEDLIFAANEQINRVNVEFENATDSRTNPPGHYQLIAQIALSLDKDKKGKDICKGKITYEPIGTIPKKHLKTIKSSTIEVDPIVKGVQLTVDQLVAEIEKQFNHQISIQGLRRVNRNANSSVRVDATLKKVTGSTELTLMAINASCSIKAALDMLTDVVDDEEFINSFTDDEERSIEITDLGDNYDVEEIDEVDITPTYNVLFRQASYLCSKLAAARWALGEIEWNKLLPICSIEWALSNLLNSAASWVVRHEGRYPTPQNPYSDCDYADFSCCEDESGKLQPECLQSMLLEDLDELVLLLDNYYVNLEYDEQNVVATALTEFKRTLTYAR